MRFDSLTTLIMLSIISSSTVAADIDEQALQCRNGGPSVLSAWYQLDTCLKYNKSLEGKITEARNLFATTYPKLKLEIDTESALVTSQKEIGNGLPYDFSHNRNAQLLNNICSTAMEFLHVVATKQEWVTALSCWR